MLQTLSKVPAETVKQQLEGILNQTSEVFREGIGTLKHTKAWVMIHENAQAKFCKAHLFPYSLYAKVDELDYLERESSQEFGEKCSQTGQHRIYCK